jgi:haloalkane dehalogenase
MAINWQPWGDELLRVARDERRPVPLPFGDPGVVVPPSAVGWYTSRIVRLSTSFVGRGLHLLPKDQPDALGRALADWLRRIG